MLERINREQKTGLFPFFDFVRKFAMISVVFRLSNLSDFSDISNFRICMH